MQKATFGNVLDRYFEKSKALGKGVTKRTLMGMVDKILRTTKKTKDRALDS